MIFGFAEPLGNLICGFECAKLCKPGNMFPKKYVLGKLTIVHLELFEISEPRIIRILKLPNFEQINILEI